MSDEESHGHSRAAWTGVGILLVATAFICLGMVFEWIWLWILGIVVGLAGIGAWVALEKAGYGDTGHPQTGHTDTGHIAH